MRRILIRGFLLTAACCLTLGHGNVASADVAGSTSNGTDIAIPDNNSGGVNSSFTSVTITDNEIIEDITFTIEGLDHGFIGDLVATVTRFDVNGNQTGTATLFNRVGRNGFGVGDSSNVLGDYSFNDDPSNSDLWQVAANTATDANVPQGTFFTSTPNTGLPANSLSQFLGQSTEGLWVLNLSDNNGGTAGTFREFSVSFESSAAVPEPSTIAILALGMTGLISIRRKRS